MLVYKLKTARTEQLWASPGEYSLILQFSTIAARILLFDRLCSDPVKVNPGCVIVAGVKGFDKNRAPLAKGLTRHIFNSRLKIRCSH